MVELSVYLCGITFIAWKDMLSECFGVKNNSSPSVSEIFKNLIRLLFKADFSSSWLMFHA